VAENNSVIVEAGDKKVQLPVLSGSLGPDCIDIGKLYKETGNFTYDPGFMSSGELPQRDHLHRRRRRRADVPRLSH
jgi:hypothetical protein